VRLSMTKIHEYCCCAIPVHNFGIYCVLIETIVVGITAGTLSIAAPTIIGANLPSFAKWVFAIICYAAAGVQLMGFLGVVKEKPTLFKTFQSLNFIAMSLVFGVAAALIGLAAGRHNTARTKCQQNFYSDSSSELEKDSGTICSAFAWADVGLMALLWVLLAIVQFYFVLITRWYAAAKAEDRKEYFSVYSVGGNPDDIVLQPRGDALQENNTYDAQGQEIPRGERGQYSHIRQASEASTLQNEEPYIPPDANSAYHYSPHHTDYEDGHQEYHDDLGDQGHASTADDRRYQYQYSPTR